MIAHDDPLAEVRRLTAFLHAHQIHPDFRYASTYKMAQTGEEPGAPDFPGDWEVNADFFEGRREIAGQIERYWRQRVKP